MESSIRIEAEPAVIRATVRGKAEPQAATRMIREVGRLAGESGARRVLFDIRDASYEDYYVETIRHVEQGAALGIEHDFRIAVLATPNRMLEYIENVAVNRGYKTRAFTEESAALAWLREDLG